MTFGEKLMQARLTMNLSQAELAQKIGVTQRSIYRYEQAGHTPRPATLKRLADTLHVSVAYLMDADETSKTKHIHEELFFANAKNEYGVKGAKEAQAILDKVSALFAGGELGEEAKAIFIQSLMEVFMESKAEAQEKFAPKSKKTRKKRKSATNTTL